MAQLQLLAAENSLNRSKRGTRQTLQFWLAIENAAYHKQVDVVWSGEDGIWHEAVAHYRYTRGDGTELWHARVTLSGRSGRMLPGSVRFAARLRSDGSGHWENNGGADFLLRSNCGTTLFGGRLLQNLMLDHALADDQHWLPIQIATASGFAAKQVSIRWTTDNWRHSHQTDCRRARQSKLAAGQVWNTRLKVADVFALEYCIVADDGKRQIWDNNHGRNYRFSRSPLSVMILNLHCYQEDDQQRKFRQIAKAIEEQAADVVCFQEAAEHWNNGHGDWASNSANIINQHLKRPMHIYYDWSHLGFDRFREGVAILSRYPLLQQEARYVSDSHDPYSIHSRKVVMAQIQVPYIGLLNVFSAHLSWWEDGFREQFQRLCSWAENLRHEGLQATLLCGDFNIAAGSIGYRQVVEHGRYQDQYLAVNHRGLFDKIFRVNDPHWQHLLADDYRIDYIFMNKDAGLRATTARVVFTEQDYGQVSDHCGFLMQFEPT